jgi:hypothetical protein
MPARVFGTPMNADVTPMNADEGLSGFVQLGRFASEQRTRSLDMTVFNLRSSA